VRILGVDYDGNGSLSSTLLIDERPATVDSGHLDLQIAALPAAKFELRAEKTVNVKLTSDLVLTGFVGGVENFDATGDIRIETTGTLTLRGGIVRAQGDLTLKADTFTTDQASVAIADTLTVTAERGIQLNTLTAHLRATSTDGGDITINEAGADVTVESIEARDGAIRLEGGGNLSVRRIVNFADGDDIYVKAAGSIAIDYIEAGSAVGAQKLTTGAASAIGRVTIDAGGVIKELATAGGSFDQDAADIYAAELQFLHNGTVVSKRLVTSQDRGDSANLDQLEIRIIGSVLTQGATTVTQEAQAVAGGSIINYQPTEITAPGVYRKQVELINFDGAQLANQIYVVTLNGQRYAQPLVAAGVVPTPAEFTAMLSLLKVDIEQDGDFTVDVGSDGSLTITRTAFNTSFTAAAVVRENVFVPFANQTVNDGSVPITAAGASLVQLSAVRFASDLVIDTGKSYSVVVDGVTYTAQVGTTAGNATVVAGDFASLIRVFAAQVDADVAGKVNAAERVVDLSAVSVNQTTPGTYTVTIAGQSFSYPALVGDGAAEVAQALAQAITDHAGTNYIAQAQGSTLLLTGGVDGGTVISTSGGGMSVDPASARTLWLLGQTANVPFSVGAISITETPVSATPTAAATGVKQVSTVSFSSTPLAETAYAITVGGRAYTFVTDATPTGTELAAGLAAAVTADAGRAAVASASGAVLTLTGNTDAVSFTLTAAAASRTSANIGAVVGDPNLPLVAADTAAKQLTGIEFASDFGVDAFKTYSITAGGATYTAQVGDVVDGVTVTSNNFASVLRVLAARANANADIDAAERVINLDALNPAGFNGTSAYTITIGSVTASYAPPAGTSLGQVAAELARQLDLDGTLVARSAGNDVLVTGGATIAQAVTTNNAGLVVDDPAGRTLWLVGEALVPRVLASVDEVKPDVLVVALALRAPQRIAHRHVGTDLGGGSVQHLALLVVAERLARQHQVLVQGHVLVRLVLQTVTVATPNLHKYIFRWVQKYSNKK